MRITDVFSYCFNPFDPSQHSFEKLKTLGIAARFFILFTTAIATVVSFGIGTLATFRFLTHLFTIKKPGERTEEEERVRRAAQQVLTLPDEKQAMPQEIKSPSPEPPQREIPEALSEKEELEAPLLQSEEYFLTELCETPSLEDSLSEDELKFYVRKDIDFSEEKDLPIPDLPTTTTTTTVSKETLENKAALQSYVETHALGSLGRADDTGDCFYDSVARLLTWHKERAGSEKIISKKEVREAIGEYLKNLKDPAKIQQLKKIYEDEGGLEAYREKVRLTHEDILELRKKYRMVALKVNEKRAEIRDLIFEEAEQEKLDRAIKEFQQLQEALSKEAQPPPAPTWGGEGDSEIIKEIYGYRVWILHSGLVKDKVEKPYISSADDETKLPILWIALSARAFGGHFDPVIPPEPQETEKK